MDSRRDRAWRRRTHGVPRLSDRSGAGVSRPRASGERTAQSAHALRRRHRGDRPSRREARQHLPRPRRWRGAQRPAREAPRLRHRQAARPGRRRDDAHGRDHRDPLVHGARAARQLEARRSQGGPLRARHRAVRDADRRLDPLVRGGRQPRRAERHLSPPGHRAPTRSASSQPQRQRRARALRLPDAGVRSASTSQLGAGVGAHVGGADPSRRDPSWWSRDPASLRARSIRPQRPDVRASPVSRARHAPGRAGVAASGLGGLDCANGRAAIGAATCGSGDDAWLLGRAVGAVPRTSGALVTQGPLRRTWRHRSDRRDRCGRPDDERWRREVRTRRPGGSAAADRRRHGDRATEPVNGIATPEGIK